MQHAALHNVKGKVHSILRTQLRDLLSSIKIMIIFNDTSADFVMISSDVLSKMIIILIELRIMQLCSKNERTLTKSVWNCIV